MSTLTDAIVDDLAAEMARAYVKFGHQTDICDGTGAVWQQQEAAFARASCQSAFGTGDGSWMAVLHEEVAEAFAEHDPQRLRAELIQVAAVALRWVAAIDTRTEVTR